MTTVNAELAKVLKPTWRRLLEGAIEDKTYGEDGSLAAHICETLIVLPYSTPNLLRAQGAVFRQLRKLALLPNEDIVLFRALFQQIWGDITERRPKWTTEAVYTRVLHLEWHSDYDIVLADYRQQLRQHLPAREQRDAIVVMLRALERVKQDRCVGIADIEQIIYSLDYSMDQVGAAWKLLRLFCDRLPETAGRLRASQAATAESSARQAYPALIR